MNILFLADPTWPDAFAFAASVFAAAAVLIVLILKD